jgi:hypothetical protein
MKEKWEKGKTGIFNVQFLSSCSSPHLPSYTSLSVRNGKRATRSSAKEKGCTLRSSSVILFAETRNERREAKLVVAGRKKEIKTGTPDNAHSCAGVQLNAPTYRMHERRLPAVAGMPKTDTGFVTNKR